MNFCKSVLTDDVCLSAHCKAAGVGAYLGYRGARGHAVGALWHPPLQLGSHLLLYLEGAQVHRQGMAQWGGGGWGVFVCGDVCV